ncbi:MAG: alpha-glucuronidase [Sphingomonadales bacterium]|nr:MAG: alpha-glucuronidase [Sphingomonadales bacterium]
MRVRGLVNRLAEGIFALAIALSAAHPARAEDGYELWLRYAPLTGEARDRLAAFDPRVIPPEPASPTLAAAGGELNRGLRGLLGKSPDGNGRITFGCGRREHGDAGHFTVSSKEGEIRIAGSDHISCLYGAFALLRELSLGRDPAAIALDETPAMPLRLLNHWDNPDGHVERGYSGRSIFDWWRLPERLDPRIVDYARANASLGINGVVVNNVNASPLFLTPRYLPKLARLADAWRPYGIRLYISARFSAPRDIGGLATADPLDPAVKAWWRAKADEIYAAIPDFGGFLVKANSEGQPGPQDYDRTHADGANMLGAALGKRGSVIWRAFVYKAENETDRVKQAYAEFTPLDGKFAPNVIVQVKNGPLDFQPREPFHPLFGDMPKTRLMLEVQATREYLGQASGIAFLAPMWSEVLGADSGRGGTVAQVIAPAGMAGIANTGSDRNWTGGQFDQANWYAFGRLAWNPSLDPGAIAREWAAQTFSRDSRFIEAVVPLMLASRATVEGYTAPFGLAHQMATGHHYGPAPWVCDLARPEWNPCYYARADKDGIGFDRTHAGSNALSQYAPRVAAQWADPVTMDQRLLLWFHRLPWSYRMHSGRSLWEELVTSYDRGEAAAAAQGKAWGDLADFVDAERHADVAAALTAQQREARWWRDASLTYWQSVNGLPLPVMSRAPEHSLEWYKAQSFPEAPGQ